MKKQVKNTKKVGSIQKQPKRALERNFTPLRATPKSKRKPSLKTLRNKCDKLLTPIIKELYPNCLLCGRPTDVAHHHVHKSKSSILRYDIDNLINLCHSCHFALHQNESYYASKIIQIKGLDWFNELEKRKNQIIKVDRFFYEQKHTELSTLLK